MTTADPSAATPATPLPDHLTDHLTGVLDWLLDSDPAIRWQALRDLTDAPFPVVAAERARVATTGWGARLLAARDADGQWAGGACFPARDRMPHEDGQPWISTLPVLTELCELGLDPASDVAREMTDLVAAHCRWEYDGSRFFDGEVEPCINGHALTIGARFGADVDGLLARLLADQLDDGGWNCATETGSTVASFHSTICVLEGLLEHEMATGGTAESTAARRRGEAYLLERSLLRRRSTGEVVDQAWLAFSFPTRWHYDVLRGLEHFRRADVRDPRLAEAVDLVRSKRRPDGTWPLENTHPGAVQIRFEDVDGTPSRWNTLRAARVLRWWES